MQSLSAYESKLVLLFLSLQKPSLHQVKLGQYFLLQVHGDFDVTGSIKPSCASD